MAERWNPAADTWLAGFTDGEGSFGIYWTSSRDRTPCLHAKFTLGLRADDLPVLRTLKDTFGGCLRFDYRGTTGPAPRYVWGVSKKSDLRRLVDYFDRFPLRSKKARDYALWREAALLYADLGGVRAAPQLLALRDALMAGRVFDDAVLQDGDREALERETARITAGRG